MTTKSPSIIIIEDNPGDIELMRLALSELDFDINFRIFEDGQDALNFLQNKAFDKRVFDLVVMDINLPGLSGFEILEQLNDEVFEIPMVIFSSLKSSEHKQRALHFNIKEYLVKPTSTQEYFRIVQSFSRYW